MTSTDPSFRYLGRLLEERTGQTIGENRMWRIETVLKSLIRERGMRDLRALVAELKTHKDIELTEAVVSALLNNETFFFRDAQAFDLVRNNALQHLRAARAASRRIAIWSAGCSTGQEAYSLAMIFADADAEWQDWSIEIVATDVSPEAIARAKAGRYTQFEIQRGLPVTTMLRWFDQAGEEWQVKRELGRRIRFKRHNLLSQAPGRFDLVLCRNLLLYLTPERRAEAFDRIAASLAPDGFLMLGAGETVIGQTDAFASDPANRGLYRPVPVARQQAA